MTSELEKFKKKNAVLIARAEAKGIDWEKLWAKFGPLVKLILETLLK